MEKHWTWNILSAFSLFAFSLVSVLLHIDYMLCSRKPSVSSGLVADQWHWRVKVNVSSWCFCVCLHAFVLVKELTTQHQLALTSIPARGKNQKPLDGETDAMNRMKTELVLSLLVQVQWTNTAKVSCSEWMDIVWIFMSGGFCVCMCVCVRSTFYGAAVMCPHVSQPTTPYRHIPVHLLSVLIAVFYRKLRPSFTLQTLASSQVSFSQLLPINLSPSSPWALSAVESGIFCSTCGSKSG